MASLLREVRLLLSIPSLFLFVATLVTGAGLLTLQPDRPFFWIPAGLAFSFLFRYGLSMSFAVVLGELSAFLITGHSTLHGLASGLASIVSVLPLVYRHNHLKISREDHMWRRFMLAFLIALPVGTTLRFLTNDVGWIEWYMRVFTGILFPGLPLLLWSRSSRFSGDAGLWERVAVTTVFLLSLPVVFFDNIVPFLPLPYAYLPAMLVIWIALRMGDFSGAAAMLLLGLAAFPGTALNEGSFANQPASLRIYLAFLAIITFFLTSLIERQTLLLKQQIEQDTLFRLFLERTRDIIYRARRGSNAGLEFMSPSVTEFLGYTPSDFTSNPALLIELIHPEDHEIIARIRSSSEKVQEAEFRIFDRKGHLHWAELRQVTLKDEQGNTVAVEGVVRDITDRKQASNRILHLNGLLHSIRQINQLITRERDREIILKESCNILVQNRGYRVIWIGLPDREAKHIEVAAVAGEGSGYTDGLTITIDGSVTGLGPSGRAWATGKTVLTSNVTSDPAFAPWKDRAARFGIHSSLAIPLVHADVKYGLMNVYTDDSLQFNEEEIGLLGEVAGDIAYSLYNIEREAEIEKLAYYDPLTDLANRRLLLDHLEHEMAFLRRRNRFGALLYLDLDNFKHVNDSYGHDTGDEILREVARRLRARLREEDTVARLGGDEFVILLFDLADSPDEAAKQAQSVAEQVQLTLQPPCIVGQNTFNLTPSIGVTVLPRYDQSPQDVIREADTAMYRTKMEGRNGYRFFHPEMQRMAEFRLSMEQELHRAIQGQEFTLHYQPQVDTEGRTVGLEALLRWQHPTMGTLGPDKYIGIAEETGLIVPLGRQILRMACGQLQIWKAQGFQGTMAVNISARQFRDPYFVKDVQDALAETGVDPGSLLLEITESVFLDNLEESIEKMEDLCATGIRFSVDDFGTGYSSLTYLKRLPLYEIKIDRSFTRDAVSNDFSRAIIRTIVTIAEHLQMTVIAEGVETDDQQKTLIDLGCRRFQGYYTGRPVPADQVFAEQKKSGQ